jgi:hypothetical protein
VLLVGCGSGGVRAGETPAAFDVRRSCAICACSLSPRSIRGKCLARARATGRACRRSCLRGFGSLDSGPALACLPGGNCPGRSILAFVYYWRGKTECKLLWMHTGDTLSRALPGLLACGWRFPRPAFCCSVPCVGPVAMREADACRGPRSLPRPSGERASSRGADLCCCRFDLAGGTCGWRSGLAVHTRVPHSGMPGCLEGISRHRCEAGGLVVPGATPTCLIASLAQLYVAVF